MDQYLGRSNSEGTPNVDPSAALTALGAGMANLHEMYESAIKAGFTEQQAMQIVLAVVAGGMAASA